MRKLINTAINTTINTTMWMVVIPAMDAVSKRIFTPMGNLTKALGDDTEFREYAPFLELSAEEKNLLEGTITIERENYYIDANTSYIEKEEEGKPANKLSLTSILTSGLWNP